MIKASLPAGLLVLALAPSLPALAQSAAPAAQKQDALSDPAAKQIRDFYDVLLATMKDAKALGVNGRYKKLEPAIDAAFDFATMTKRTVGPQWDSMPQPDRDKLIAAFRRLTIADYAHNFDGYGGETFVVDPTVQERKGDKVVSSKMIVPGKQAIPFVYRMDQTPKGWKIVDIFLNGYVSEVATRRADFAATLKNGGAGALAQKLDAMTDKTLKDS